MIRLALLLFLLQQNKQYCNSFAHFNYLFFSQIFNKKLIMILKLVTTPLRCAMTIQKLNNITMNSLKKQWPNMDSDIWRFDTSKDWKVLRDYFASISTAAISDTILQGLGFYFSILDFLEKKVPCFIDVIDKSEITIGLINNSQLITDFKEEKMRRKEEYLAKRKT